MGHTCHAHECNVPVPPRMFACLAHWRALRPATQRAIWREYRNGQEIDKKPSLRYLAVQQFAVAELAFKPGSRAAAIVSAKYLANAETFRQKAIAEGRGDPFEGLVPAMPPKRRRAAGGRKHAS